MINAFKIFTKEDYKRYRLRGLDAPSISRGTLKTIDKTWNKISKGYNFVIGVGKNDIMFYSVEYFNDNILEGNNKIRTSKEVETLTVGLDVDTKEFKEKLNEMEQQLERLGDKARSVMDVYPNELINKVEDIRARVLADRLTDTIRMLVYKE